MLNTNATYKAIVGGDYTTECRVIIEDTSGTEHTVGHEGLISIETSEGCFDTFGIGNAVAAEVNLTMLVPKTWTPKRMARMRVHFRVKNATQTSSWYVKGIFYIDTRERTKNLYGEDIMIIHGYDRMLMSEQMYANVSWTTKRDYEVLQEICTKLPEWTLNSETLTYLQAQPAINISTPYGFTYREVLQSIAGMRAGNFVIDEAGRLKFIPLNSAPAETFYLITPQGNPITIGGDRIVLR